MMEDKIYLYPVHLYLKTFFFFFFLSLFFSDKIESRYSLCYVLGDKMVTLGMREK